MNYLSTKTGKLKPEWYIYNKSKHKWTRCYITKCVIKVLLEYNITVLLYKMKAKTDKRLGPKA